MKQEQKPLQTQPVNSQPAQNTNAQKGEDPRQQAIEQEEDTARLRSEKQSVEDGAKKKDD